MPKLKLGQIFKNIPSFIKACEEGISNRCYKNNFIKKILNSLMETEILKPKRKHGVTWTDNDTPSKNPRSSGFPYKKKKVAMLLVYSGRGFYGMQRNPGFRTIESELTDALLKAGVITEEHAKDPSTQMSFQRAARTDKGVSSAGQIVSLKIFIDVENIVEKINSHLVPEIRVIGYKKTTKSFNSKNNCSSRTYSYTLPTFAFAPIDTIVNCEYRITDEIISRVNRLLAQFKGTHNFHNFTSGKLPTERSAQRYIIDIMCGNAFLINDMEFVQLKIHGQSFMLHQIRKMVGIVIAILRDYANEDLIEKSWQSEKCDIPKAPGLGLVLEQCHFDQYNNRFGNDGIHVPIDWNEYTDNIELFKKNHIHPTIFETEKNENSMLNWLSTLDCHNFVPELQIERFGAARKLKKVHNLKQSTQIENDTKQTISEGEPAQQVVTT